MSGRAAARQCAAVPGPSRPVHTGRRAKSFEYQHTIIGEQDARFRHADFDSGTPTFDMSAPGDDETSMFLARAARALHVNNQAPRPRDACDGIKPDSFAVPTERVIIPSSQINPSSTSVALACRAIVQALPSNPIHVRPDGLRDSNNPGDIHRFDSRAGRKIIDQSPNRFHKAQIVKMEG